MKYVKSIVLALAMVLIGLGIAIASATTSGSVLPPLHHDKQGVALTYARSLSIPVKSFSIRGNTVVANHVLADIVTQYVNRRVSYSELAQLKDQLTLAYVERGFISSGATIDRQALPHGELSIDIVEGVIADVEITNTGRLRDSYLRKKVQAHEQEVVNLITLEQRLQILQQDERIESVQSQLLPGAVRGKSILAVSLKEARPYKFSVELSNHESPNVGAERVLLAAEHNNLTGFGDSLQADYRKSKGLDAWRAGYAFPITRSGVTLFVDAQGSDSDVVEDTFESLNINSSARTYRVGIDYPLYRSVRSQLNVTLSADKRESESFLLGLPFSFTEGVEDGVADVSAVRLGLNWNRRGRQRALALRSTISFGVDAFDATTNSGDLPDSEFIKWLLQGQWARRIDWLNSRVIVSGRVQISDSPLLGLERIALGGHDTVRGYRENILSGDNGAMVSLEWQFPVLTKGTGGTNVVVAPFLDSGRVWSEGDSSNSESLSSAGFNVLWKLNRQTDVNFSWAHSFDSFGSNGDLQDDGLHIQARYSF